jgi:DNA mismatch endonuclease (patch repair protein)
MSRIRSAGNRDTELRLIAVFRANGITGWRRGARIKFQVPRDKYQGNQRKEDGGMFQVPSSKFHGNQSEPGGAKAKGPKAKIQNGSKKFQVKPDFVFPKLKLAVFVDGCFWHGCPRHFIQPRGNAAFWRKKIAANRTRDRLVNRMLRSMGWRVLRVWEHELALKNMSRLLRRIRRMIAA